MIPRVQNVSCYLSRAETGGLKGGLDCRRRSPAGSPLPVDEVGPVTMPSSMPKSEVIAFSAASLFFKTFQIHRALDPEKHVLVYTVVSMKLINGSPFKQHQRGADQRAVGPRASSGRSVGYDGRWPAVGFCCARN